MTDSEPESERLSREAAEWMARLNRRDVEGTTLEEFFVWRRAPGNDAAFRHIEALWDRSGRLRTDHDVASALIEALETPGKRRRWWNVQSSHFGPFKAAFAVLLAAGLGAIAIWQLMPLRYVTGIGEQRLIALSDGSHVRLDTDSRITIRFSGRARQLDLDRGRAFFDVAHDAGRPFVVHAGDSSVTAIGTRFDVQRDTADVRVVLTRGVIDVADGFHEGTAPLRLIAGEEILLSPKRRSHPVGVDADAAIGWTEGRLNFTDTPLVDAVAEVGRYAPNGIILDAPALAQAKVNGVFETGDIDAFLTAVTALFPLHVEHDPRGVIRLTPKA